MAGSGDVAAIKVPHRIESFGELRVVLISHHLEEVQVSAETAHISTGRTTTGRVLASFSF